MLISSSVIDIAMAFKQYLLSLPEPLCTYDLFDDFVNVKSKTPNLFSFLLPT